MGEKIMRVQEENAISSFYTPGGISCLSCPSFYFIVAAQKLNMVQCMWALCPLLKFIEPNTRLGM